MQSHALIDIKNNMSPPIAESHEGLESTLYDEKIKERAMKNSPSLTSFPAPFTTKNSAA